MIRPLLATAIIMGALAGNAAAQVSQSGQPFPPPQYPQPPATAQPADPNAPRRLDTFGDKALRCMHYGGTQGVPAGQLGQYMRECVNSQ